jgi:trehalose/maltose hydrolase-like predicted phosphorylase
MHFFRQASATDLADTHAAIDGGVHIAALGGMWMMAVLGFAGLAMDEASLSFNPQLPDDWHSLAFSVQWQGRHVSISIDGAKKTFEATLKSGDPVTLTLSGKQHQLTTKAPLVVEFLDNSRSATPTLLG